jgi:hypothetical protein
MRTLIALGLLAVIGPSPAAAQQPASCPQGRTAAGACVDADLARLVRERTTCMSQGKINGVLGCPVAPSRDNVYPKGREWNRFDLGPDGIFRTAPGP